MKNIDKIKSFDIDDMAKFLDKYFSCDFCEEMLYKHKCDTPCIDYCDKRINIIKNWLQKEGRYIWDTL